MLGDAGRKALAFLATHPDASDRYYAEVAGISQPGAHQLLRRLEALGLVERIRNGRVMSNRLTPSGKRVLRGPREATTRDRVQEALAIDPTLSRRALAAQLGISSTTVQYHARRLGA